MLRFAVVLLTVMTSASAQELNPNGVTEKEYQECGERWGAPGAIAECLLQRDKAYGVQLEEAYRRALDVTPDKALVRRAQRSWLNYQQATCKFHNVYAQREGMGIARALAARCQLLTTLQRIRELYPVLGCAWDEGGSSQMLRRKISRILNTVSGCCLSIRDLFSKPIHSEFEQAWR